MAKKRKTRKANNNLLPKVLIALGLLLLFFGTFTHFQIYSNYLISKSEAPVKLLSTQVPTSIIIPEIGLNEKVIEGGIVRGNWVLSDDDALYLPTSGKVGEGYNTIIYAHNTSKLFGSLINTKIGDTILLKDRSGKVFEYRIYEKKDVNPYDLKSLYSKDANIVTLFTCDGWLDQKRLLVRGKLVSSSENIE